MTLNVVANYLYNHLPAHDEVMSIRLTSARSYNHSYEFNPPTHGSLVCVPVCRNYAHYYQMSRLHSVSHNIIISVRH